MNGSPLTSRLPSPGWSLDSSVSGQATGTAVAVTPGVGVLVGHNAVTVGDGVIVGAVVAVAGTAVAVTRGVGGAIKGMGVGSLSAVAGNEYPATAMTIVHKLINCLIFIGVLLPFTFRRVLRFVFAVG